MTNGKLMTMTHRLNNLICKYWRLLLEIVLVGILAISLAGYFVVYKIADDRGYAAGVQDTAEIEFYRGVYAYCYQFTMYLSGGLENEVVQACTEAVIYGREMEVDKWDYPGWPLDESADEVTIK